MGYTALHLDFETRSQCCLKTRGLYTYADDPSTDILVACFAFDDGPVESWVPGKLLPNSFVEHIRRGGLVYAHNAAFEIAITSYVAYEKYGWPIITADQAICTMAKALAMSLPASLEQLAPALGLTQQKDTEGHRLMMKLSKSTAPVEPKDLERLTAYCAQDVEVERAADKRMLNLSPSERKVWILDQKINRRGIRADIQSIGKAILVVDSEKEKLDQKMATLTNGIVSKCTNVGQLKDWLEDKIGREVPTLDKSAVAELIGLEPQETSTDVKTALLLRQEAGKSSVSKLEAMRDRANTDDRIRGTMQYHGAGTGRWAGRGIQPQNFPRGRYKPEEVEDIFSLFGESPAAEHIALFYGKPLRVISDCLRAFIIASPGAVLFSGDFAGIEARVIAWLANEKSVLDIFRRGEDPYVYAYARAFHIDPKDVTTAQRAIGKVMVLALGFGGGAGAFSQMAKTFGLIVDEDEAENLKQRWRQAHPSIVKFWYALENLAMDACRYPGEKFHANEHVAFKKKGSFLFCQLPSGRVISYPYPKIELQTYKNKKGFLIEREGLTYMGVHPKTRKWDRLKAYGGLLAENVTQATARDLMVRSMFNLEEAEYRVVFTVHDEIVVEHRTKDIAEDKKQIERLMVDTPSWATGLPVGVEVKAGKRYAK